MAIALITSVSISFSPHDGIVIRTQNEMVYAVGRGG